METLEKRIHFVGIGGIGMSALARLYHQKGWTVSGSDREDSVLLHALRREGITVFSSHATDQVPHDVEAVVYSEAIPLDNVELQSGRSLNLTLKTYFEALGEWTEEYRAICVAGTHGKTTTTALISLLLLATGQDPTVVIGTQMSELEGKNMRLGQGKIMVVESCEYRRSFLHLKPYIAVLTNIELDHVDYYRDEEDYLSAFQDFVSRIDPKGVLVANGEDNNVRKVAQSAPCKVVYYSFQSPKAGSFNLQVPGTHNLSNALAAYAVGEALNLNEKTMLQALSSFKGTWRRFEYKGAFNGADIYDDYAHHPTEIQATLQAAREKYPDHRLIAVFQPHQYSRAHHFLDGFARAFTLADEVVIPNIYEARDSQQDKKAVSVESLVHEIQKFHPEVRNGEGLEKTAQYLKEMLQPNDLVLLMGAGDVWKVGDSLLSR